MQSFLQYRWIGRQIEKRSQEHNSVRRFPIPESHQGLEENDLSGKVSPASSEFSSLTDTNGDQHGIIVVGWEGSNDPLNPRNWSMARRCLVFAILWINVFAVDWASSADSQAASIITGVFHVSSEAESLSPSLYTFGLAAGSLLAGPLSETAGRNPVYVISRIFHVAWLLGVALSPNFAAQIIFRLFAGLSGSVLLAIHAASIADLFGPIWRTLFWPIIALASFWGTAVSPVPGAWIAQTIPSAWRWTEWIPFILSGSTLFLTLFFLPETFSPVLLQWKAANLRRITGNQRFQAEMDLQKSLLQRFKTACLRALHMITREPVVVLMGMWLVFEYIVVFGFLHGFDFVFGDTYGFSRGYVGTCFLAIAVGTSLWTAGIPLYYLYYVRKTKNVHQDRFGEKRKSAIAKANTPGCDLPEPEYRLWSALFAAPAFPISLFWMGWTNYAGISPWSDLGAVALLGFSWAGIYVTVYQYILDVYGIYAGSALAVVTCWRYLASGTINLISGYIYDGIGVQWACTLFGIIAAILTPLPLIFYYAGPGLRKRSPFAGRYSRPANARERIGKMINYA